MLLPALVAFVAVALGTVSLALSWEWLQEQQRKRQMVVAAPLLANETLDRAGGLGRSSARRSSSRPGSGRSRPACPRSGTLELLLQQARSHWTLQTLFLLLSVGLAVALGLVALIAHAVVPVGVRHRGLRAPAADTVRPAAAQQRLDAFEELLPESIDLVGRAIRAGHPLSAGLKMAADEAASRSPASSAASSRSSVSACRSQDSLLGMADRVTWWTSASW